MYRGCGHAEQEVERRLSRHEACLSSGPNVLKGLQGEFWG
jgi:hypothetical protein